MFFFKLNMLSFHNIKDVCVFIKIVNAKRCELWPKNALMKELP